MAGKPEVKLALELGMWSLKLLRVSPISKRQKFGNRPLIPAISFLPIWTRPPLTFDPARRSRFSAQIWLPVVSRLDQTIWNRVCLHFARYHPADHRENRFSPLQIEERHALKKTAFHRFAI